MYCQPTPDGVCRYCKEAVPDGGRKGCEGWEPHAEASASKLATMRKRRRRSRWKAKASSLIASLSLRLGLRRVVRFGVALWRWWRGGFKRRTDAEIEELLAICQDCPSDMHDAERSSCKACGCPVAAPGRWRNKLAFATETCPRGHW